MSLKSSRTFHYSTYAARAFPGSVLLLTMLFLPREIPFLQSISINMTPQIKCYLLHEAFSVSPPNMTNFFIYANSMEIFKLPHCF